MAAHEKGGHFLLWMLETELYVHFIARQQLLFFTIFGSKQLVTLCCSKELMPTWISFLARSPTFTLPSRVRQHFGFQCREPISSTVDEHPEDLFQQLMAFFKDNLLSVNSGLTHPGDPVVADEDLSPSLEKTILFLCLQLINQGLPLLVSQKYGPEDPCLSQAKDFSGSSSVLSSMSYICSIEDTKTMPVSNVFPHCSADDRHPILVLCSVQKLLVVPPTPLILWIAVTCLSVMGDFGHSLSQPKN